MKFILHLIHQTMMRISSWKEIFDESSDRVQGSWSAHPHTRYGLIHSSFFWIIEERWFSGLSDDVQRMQPRRHDAVGFLRHVQFTRVLVNRQSKLYTRCARIGGALMAASGMPGQMHRPATYNTCTHSNQMT